MGLPQQNDNTPVQSALNVTTTTVLKQTGGFLFTVITGAAAVSLYDSNQASGNTAANLIVTTVASTITQINFPFKNGLLVTGAGPASIAFQ
jgi:hypothetical protein